MIQSRYAGALLCSAMLAVLPACSDQAPDHQAIVAAASTHAEKVHGAGKKELDCDMAHVTVEHGSISNVIAIDDLLTRTGAEVAYEDDQRIQDKRAIPLLELLEQSAPDATRVVLFSCGETKGRSIDAATVAGSPAHYLLTENNVGRLRVALFNDERRRYQTLVKNLVRIRLEQPAGG